MGAEDGSAPAEAGASMDALSISEITNLSTDKVSSVLKKLNNDQREVERALCGCFCKT